jgi:hypothetical protein
MFELTRNLFIIAATQSCILIDDLQQSGLQSLGLTYMLIPCAALTQGVSSSLCATIAPTL